ncbi:MAG: oligoendopeptidase F [Chloroflexota bacterium]|nr:oligoendopeptidase F [Chloroflexota bacterium]
MSTTAPTSVPTRRDVPVAERWDIESVYESIEDWERAYKAVEARLPEISRLQATLTDSPATLLAGLRLIDEIAEAVENLLVYAYLRRSEDATNSRVGEITDQVVGLATRAEAAGSFVGPAIAALADETIAAWYGAEPQLRLYRYALEQIQRQRAHIRSAEVEEVLALAGEMGNAFETIHDSLENGELPLGTIKDERGHEVELAQGNLDTYLQSPDRRVRKDAWESSADAYLKLQNTMGATLTGAIKRDVFYAQTHNYPSSLAAALAPTNTSEQVFRNLLDTVWANFPVWQRYFRVRRQLLGLSEGDLHGYDLEAPLSSDPAVAWDRGVALILDSLQPLGGEYVETVCQGMIDRWVDRAANLGKGGGAFSGGGYRTYPFISMTYQNRLTDVSTLTHEIGHSMHSHLTNTTQPYVYSGYGMAAAETASNFNQQLLGASLLAANDERGWVIAVIEERMANHQRYLFTMPILARFELACHERLEAGDALSAEWMSETLLGFYREGYGAEVVIDPERIGITWARFPHLFMNFYVFQYGIGISASAALAADIMRGDEAATERYLTFLRSGGSKDQIQALLDAGIDMSSKAPIERAFGILSGYIDRLESLVE